MGKKISIIGAGNVAWHLAPALENAGHSVMEVYSRNIKNAERLCSRLYDAFPTDDLEFSESQAEIFFIAVPDDSIEEIAASIRIPEDALIAHTSGTRSLESLSLSFERAGVFYPLQTFSKNRKVSFSEIPLCIEATEADTEKTLTAVAKSLTSKIYYISSSKRKALHVAAVFASNFTNHLLALSKEILNEEALDFKILQPLILETIHKALEQDPKAMQTGPALRRDIITLQEHLSYLQEDPHKKQIYKLLSESILRMAKE